MVFVCSSSLLLVDQLRLSLTTLIVFVFFCFLFFVFWTTPSITGRRCLKTSSDRNIKPTCNPIKEPLSFFFFFFFSVGVKADLCHTWVMLMPCLNLLSAGSGEKTSFAYRHQSEKSKRCNNCVGWVWIKMTMKALRWIPRTHTHTHTHTHTLVGGFLALLRQHEL